MSENKTCNENKTYNDITRIISNLYIYMQMLLVSGRDIEAEIVKEIRNEIVMVRDSIQGKD